MNTGYIYKLCCTDITVTEIYVGSTKSLRNRKVGHKSACNNSDSPHYYYVVYRYIRAHGGWDNWDLVVLETVQYNEKYELRARERVHIEALHATLNQKIPNQTVQEFCVVNRDRRLQEKRSFNAANRDRLAQKSKEYRAAHLDQLKQKIMCECGTMVAKEGISGHRRTARHASLLAARIISPDNIVPAPALEPDATNNSPPPLQLS